MNDIFDMAKQAHLGVTLTHDGELGQFIEGANWTEELVAFAKLVAAKEREACAKVVDDIEWKCITDDVDDPPLKEVVKAIRARGEA